MLIPLACLDVSEVPPCFWLPELVLCLHLPPFPSHVYQHVKQHGTLGTKHWAVTFCHNWPSNPPLCFLLGHLQTHNSSFPLILWPLSSLKRVFSLTLLKTFWVPKYIMSTKSTSSTVSLMRSLSCKPSVLPFFSSSCWVHALSLQVIIILLLNIISNVFPQDTCKEGWLVIPAISLEGFLNTNVTFPTAQSLLLFLSKPIKSYLNCFKMAISTHGKGLPRQSVRCLGFVVGFLSDERSIKQRNPSVSQLISGNHAEVLV